MEVRGGSAWWKCVVEVRGGSAWFLERHSGDCLVFWTFPWKQA
jgi:hypothetical protein